MFRPYWSIIDILRPFRIYACVLVSFIAGHRYSYYIIKKSSRQLQSCELSDLCFLSCYGFSILDYFSELYHMTAVDVNFFVNYNDRKLRKMVKWITMIKILKQPCVYMLRCGDGSLYTGWTNDFEKRLAAHRSGKGAKYTRGRGPLEPVYLEYLPDKQAATVREAAIKKLRPQQKRELLSSERNALHQTQDTDPAE